MNSLYFEVQLSGDAPDAWTLAKYIRETVEYWAEGQRFLCEDVKVIPNWKLERRDD